MTREIPMVPPVEDNEADRVALEAAVAEARASGPGTPHEQVRARMSEMVSAARSRIADLHRGAIQRRGRDA
jgi:hypothetical protein